MTVRPGQKFSNFFHWRDRSRTAKPKQRSAQEMLERHLAGNRVITRAMARLRKRMPRKNIDQLTWEAIRCNSAVLSVTQFPAHVAWSAAKMTEAQTVLDFSGGWGDRLTGFLAAATPDITVVEPRASACTAYLQQAAAVQSPGTTLRILCGCALRQCSAMEAAGRRFDLILTSPPYFNSELYDKAGELQVHNRFGTTEEFCKGFLFPVLCHCLSMLSEDGILMLNIDDNHAKEISICKPVLDYVESLTAFRFVGTVGLAKHQGGRMGSSTPGLRAEPIFVWARAGAAAAARSRLDALPTMAEIGRDLRGSRH